MKTSFKLSQLVAVVLVSHDKAAIIQACEASINSRTLVSSESLGTRNVKKTLQAESGEVSKYTQDTSVVTAFIQYAEAGAGACDKLANRADKLGLVVSGSAIPAVYAGHNIGEWVNKFRASAPASNNGKRNVSVKVPAAQVPA